MDEIINDDDALNHLDQLDKAHGVNKPIEEATVDISSIKPAEAASESTSESKPTSLGKARSYEHQIQMSQAEESPWKILSLDILPSRGMFYPEGAELTIRSAKTKEIRHWSTMDEHDPIDVREKINYILNKCTRFKIKGEAEFFNFNDFLDIDRYHILFRIYELTFPNQENKLMANIRCNDKTCGHVNRLQVTSKNLLGFDIPDELRKYYSPEERCFVINSEKLGKTLRFYMPTGGVSEKFREKKKSEITRGVEIDDSFYDAAPYLVWDWRNLNHANMSRFKMETVGWGDHEFAIIYKVTSSLKKASTNRAIGVCEKCKKEVESSIFLGGSFTVKDIFIISARLDELI